MKYELTSIDNFGTDIIIDWDLLTICNLKCPYCINRKSYSSWNSIVSKKNIDKVLTALRNSKYKIKITLVGGEPFLHPNFNYIINELIKIEQIKTVWIFTNGTVYKELPDSNKIVVSISYHLVQKFETYKNFLVQLKNFKHKKNLSILCYKMKHNLEKYKNVIQTAKEIIPDIVVDLEPVILGGKIQDFEYIKELIPYQNSDDAFIYHNKQYNVVDIYTKYFNHEIDLTKYICILNRYLINVFGQVSCYCISNQQSNLYTNPDYFKDLKIQKFECTDICNKRCLLDQHLGLPKILKSV